MESIGKFTGGGIVMNWENRYIFSGSLSSRMVDGLIRLHEEGKFEPMDVLVSQLDRSGVNQMLDLSEKGIVKSLFIDSGAFSIHSLGFEKVAKGKFATIDDFIDEYIDFCNGIDDKIIAIAQVDHIPGVFKQSKNPEDYEESVRLSWENFQYMLPKVKSPEKLLYVFHQGESFDALGKILDWRDENGKPIQYLGISPSNDRAVGDKDVYLKEVYDYIAKSSVPDIRTHLFGYTSLPGLPKFRWYSCDSTSHRLRAAYNKCFTRKWGTISFSQTRNARTKTDMSFPDICDADTLKELKELLDYYGYTIEDMQNESSARTVVDICETQKFVKENPYNPKAIFRTRKLFSLD